MDPWVRCHGMKANRTGYLWSKNECFLMSGCQDMDLSKTLKWRDGNSKGNGNANANAKVTTGELKITFFLQYRNIPQRRYSECEYFSGETTN